MFSCYKRVGLTYLESGVMGDLTFDARGGGYEAGLIKLGGVN